MTDARVDPKNPRMLHMEWTNKESIPVTALAAGAELKKIPKRLSNFKMFMVTRRSIVNPGEVLKFKIELSYPLEDYPDNAYLQLSYPLMSGFFQRKLYLHPD